MAYCEWVYLAQMILPRRKNGPVKIGVAAEPAERIESLSSAGPFPIQLLGYCSGSHSHEQTLHKRYAHARLRGEWFQLTPAELTVLQTQFMQPKEGKKVIAARKNKIAEEKLLAEAQEILPLLKAGKTTISIERDRLGFHSNTPLRKALIKILGSRQAYFNLRAQKDKQPQKDKVPTKASQQRRTPQQDARLRAHWLAKAI